MSEKMHFVKGDPAEPRPLGMPLPNTLPMTTKAIAIFDEGLAARDARLDAATSNEEVRRWQSVENELVRQVQLAFYEDTKNFNSVSACLSAPISDLRRFVEAAKAAGEKS